MTKEGIAADVSSDLEKKRGLVLGIDVTDKAEIETVKKLVEGYIFTSEVN